MTSDSRKMIQDIMNSESMGYAYVYPLDGGPRRNTLFPWQQRIWQILLGKRDMTQKK